MCDAVRCVVFVLLIMTKLYLCDVKKEFKTLFSFFRYKNYNDFVLFQRYKIKVEAAFLCQTMLFAESWSWFALTI